MALSMLKAVLLSINAKYVHSSLSVWYLAEGVLRYTRINHDVKVVEATINQPCADIAAKVAEHTPDVVGVSVYIWNAGKFADILNILRELLPGVIIILGGPEAAYNAEYWLNTGADYVLRGEGERAFPAFLDKEAPESIPGLCRMRDGKMHSNPQDEPPDDFVDPYSEAYFSALCGRISYIETSRGCPFRCAFCLSGGDDNVRFLPVYVAEERIYKLSQSHTQTVKLVDRTFNCNAERAYKLFSYVIGLDTKCCFHFEVVADLFDGRTISLLSTAPPGRIQLEAGLQSFYEPALAASFRRTDSAKAESNIRALLRNQNIHIHVDLIAGLPFETLLNFQDSFNRAYSLGAHTLQLGFLKMLHGSAMREQNESIIFADEPPYEIISSPWLSEADLKIIRHTENALRNTYNKSRFLSAIRYTLSVSGLRPFALYRALGEAMPNHGISLVNYAEGVYNYLIKLPGVELNELRDCMTVDWLGMVKGENMPDFLKTDSKRRKHVVLTAEKLLGRVICRNEAAVLRSGKGVFADSQNRDPVTGLYKLYYL